MNNSRMLDLAVLFLSLCTRWMLGWKRAWSDVSFGAYLLAVCWFLPRSDFLFLCFDKQPWHENSPNPASSSLQELLWTTKSLVQMSLSRSSGPILAWRRQRSCPSGTKLSKPLIVPLVPSPSIFSGLCCISKCMVPSMSWLGCAGLTAKLFENGPRRWSVRWQLLLRSKYVVAAVVVLVNRSLSFCR